MFLLKKKKIIIIVWRKIKFLFIFQGDMLWEAVLWPVACLSGGGVGPYKPLAAQQHTSVLMDNVTLNGTLSWASSYVLIVLTLQQIIILFYFSTKKKIRFVLFWSIVFFLLSFCQRFYVLSHFYILPWKSHCHKTFHSL